ncbi:hypothetical protein Mapa_007881 [Marchantia paleacea]|nr:hypothetical protein Mapa_007881 [Marchantia paleacea]
MSAAGQSSTSAGRGGEPEPCHRILTPTPSLASSSGLWDSSVPVDTDQEITLERKQLKLYCHIKYRSFYDHVGDLNVYL